MFILEKDGSISQVIQRNPLRMHQLKLMKLA